MALALLVEASLGLSSHIWDSETGADKSEGRRGSTEHAMDAETSGVMSFDRQHTDLEGRAGRQRSGSPSLFSVTDASGKVVSLLNEGPRHRDDDERTAVGSSSSSGSGGASSAFGVPLFSADSDSAASEHSESTARRSSDSEESWAGPGRDTGDVRNMTTHQHDQHPAPSSQTATQPPQHPAGAYRSHAYPYPATSHGRYHPYYYGHPPAAASARDPAETGLGVPSPPAAGAATAFPSPSTTHAAWPSRDQQAQHSYYAWHHNHPHAQPHAAGYPHHHPHPHYGYPQAGHPAAYPTDAQPSANAPVKDMPVPVPVIRPAGKAAVEDEATQAKRRKYVCTWNGESKARA